MSELLLKKLGLRAGMRTHLWRVPDNLVATLGPAIAVVGEPAVWRMGFTVDAQAISDAASEIAPLYNAREVFWLCYPKKSGRIKTDISRDQGWEPIAALGLLGVSQVAIDETWSALRFRLGSEIPKLTRRI